MYGKGAGVGDDPARSANAPHLKLLADPRRQRRLVILGGSGGARSLNEAVPAALAKLGDSLHGWQIVHQTGDDIQQLGL